MFKISKISSWRAKSKILPIAIQNRTKTLKPTSRNKATSTSRTSKWLSRKRRRRSSRKFRCFLKSLKLWRSLLRIIRRPSTRILVLTIFGHHLCQIWLLTSKETTCSSLKTFLWFATTSWIFKNCRAFWTPFRSRFKLSPTSRKILTEATTRTSKRSWPKKCAHSS